MIIKHIFLIFIFVALNGWNYVRSLEPLTKCKDCTDLNPKPVNESEVKQKIDKLKHPKIKKKLKSVYPIYKNITKEGIDKCYDLTYRNSNRTCRLFRPGATVRDLFMESYVSFL